MRGQESKMAPVCVACRLALQALSSFVLFVSLAVQNVESLLEYDRQTLLNFRHSAKDLGKCDYAGQKTLPPLQSGIPAYLCRLPVIHPWRKRHRRREKHSGRLVTVKTGLALSSMGSWTEYQAVPRLSISRRLLDPIDAWLVPVVGSDEVSHSRAPCSPRPHWRGVNLQNLQALCRVPLKVSTAELLAVPTRIGLVNARSLANKTFILRNFFTSRDLDFLCVTERWLRVVTFNNCDGRTRTLFQSVDKRFDVNTDGTVTLKRQVTLHEGHKVFSVHAWDSNGQKHTVSVKVERVHHHEGHHMDTVMKISSPEVLNFPKSSTGLKRAKREWLIPPFQVPENSRGPFPMKMVQIKSNYDKETQMLYSITGEEANSLFTIDKFSGNLFVTQPLDREKKAAYRIIAKAVARDVSNISENPMEIIINVIDQNDNKPVFTQNPFNGHVHEAATKDYEFMTVTATDADDPDTHNGIVSYAIFSQEPPSPKPNMFDINILSGTIRVRETGMDREQWPRYTLLIVAADMEGNGFSTTGTAVITITGSNDNPPQFEQTSYITSVPENKVGHEVAKLTVTDGDEERSPAWSTKYRIISGDKGGFFNVNTGPSQLEGIITTVKPLDFEKTKQYILSVIVENDDPFVGSLPTATATVTVNVEDVNEPPEFNPKEMIIVTREVAPVDTDLVTYTATDPDIGKSQKIMYKIGNDPAGWLSVSPETGVIKVRTLMDRESAYVKDGKYKAIIWAVDDDATYPATGTGTLVIDFENVNYNAPVINERNKKVCNCGSAPVFLSITDKDGPPFAAPFSVETQGETSKNWSTSMNETLTRVFLQLKTALEQGYHVVVLRDFDQHKLYQDNCV